MKGDYIIVDLTEEDLISSYRVRPTWTHSDKEQAERDLLRLQKEHPGRRFVLFQAIAEAKAVASDVFILEKNLDTVNV